MGLKLMTLYNFLLIVSSWLIRYQHDNKILPLLIVWMLSDLFLYVVVLLCCVQSTVQSFQVLKDVIECNVILYFTHIVN